MLSRIGYALEMVTKWSWVQTLVILNETYIYFANVNFGWNWKG